MGTQIYKHTQEPNGRSQNPLPHTL